MKKVMNNINELSGDILNEQFSDQKEFDDCLIKFDGTNNKFDFNKHNSSI